MNSRISRGTARTLPRAGRHPALAPRGGALVRLAAGGLARIPLC